MPDHTIPADKLREIIHSNTFQGEVMEHRRAAIIEELKALITPPLPTLADMTPEEQQNCHLMQCDVKESDEFLGGRGVIISLGRHDLFVIDEDGTYWGKGHPLENFTPRPDLPRMVWPGSEPDVSKSAPEIDTSTERVDGIDMTPRPGEAWLIEFYGRERTVLIDSNYDAVTGARGWINSGKYRPVARLVPETPRKTLVTEEDYQNAAVGTIVKHIDMIGSQAFQKWDNGDWLGTVAGDEYPFTAAGMDTMPRTILWEPED